MGNVSDCHVAKETYHPSEKLIIETKNLLKINKGDKLKMLDHETFEDYDMYLMKNLNTGEEGLVSSMFVALLGTIECEPWYFGSITRRKATDLLKASVNVQGSFLVRDSEQFPGDFSLTIKIWDEGNERFDYKHYHIYNQNDRFFITTTHQYSTLNELIRNCQENAQKGLSCKLTTVCLRPSGCQVETNLNVPRSEIKILERIGGGNFGTVHKALYRGVTEVAVKQLNSDDGMSETVKQEFTEEVKILKSLHHPNLVQVLGVCIESDPYLMVLEFLENGDLRTFLRKDKKKSTKFDKLLLICENIASGMQELAKLKVIHRDLAARNIMLDKWGQAKVGDFGLAKEGGEYFNSRTKFPVRWTSPEALKTKLFTLQSDVWSFGVVLWEIFTFGLVPYPGITSNDRILSFVEKDTNRLDKPDYKGTDEKNINLIYQIMLACWQPSPEDRPSMRKLHKDLINFGTEEVERIYVRMSAYVKMSNPADVFRSKVVENRNRQLLHSPTPTKKYVPPRSMKPSLAFR